MKKVIFDIRSEEKAILTLERLTNVDAEYWSREKVKNCGRYDYTYVDCDIERIVEINGGSYPQLRDLELVITHLTTSNNRCETILNEGIIDLKGAYANEKGELRKFLEYHGVNISLDLGCLEYKGHCYDISYKKCPQIVSQNCMQHGRLEENFIMILQFVVFYQ